MVNESLRRRRLEQWSRVGAVVAVILFLVALSRNLYHAAWPDKGSLCCNEPVHHAGIVFDGDVVEHTFQVRNIGTSKYVIEKVMTGCGCTTVEAKLNGLTILPQDAFAIPVKLRTDGRDGEFKMPAVVFFSEPANARLKLDLACNVRKRVIISLSQISLKLRSTDNEKVITFSILRPSGAPNFSVSSTHSPASWISADFKSIEKFDDSTEWLTTVAIRRPMSIGRFESTVFIETDDPHLGTIPIGVSLAVDE